MLQQPTAPAHATNPCLPPLTPSPPAVMRWAGLFSREAMGAGGAAGPISRQAQLGLLLWRVSNAAGCLWALPEPRCRACLRIGRLLWRVSPAGAMQH